MKSRHDPFLFLYCEQETSLEPEMFESQPQSLQLLTLYSVLKKKNKTNTKTPHHRKETIYLIKTSMLLQQEGYLFIWSKICPCETPAIVIHRTADHPVTRISTETQAVSEH